MSQEKLEAIISRTRLGGSELMNLMGISAWVAPGYGAARMVEAIVLDQKRYFPCSTYLSGQYGLKDIFFGVPVKLGITGVEDILELELNEKEKILVKQSADSIKATIKTLYKQNILEK